ncbi:hypothetical protein MMC13_004774 [Lambiella insularis]|nr:hypothetical protein [Lambiella insularis]
MAEGDAVPNSQILAEKYFREAREIYHSDRYERRGFEILQLLSIGYYQRDLSLLARKLVKANGIKGLDKNEEIATLIEMRRLLKGYTEAIRDLETTLQREPIWPKGVFSVRDNANSATHAAPDDYYPESYIYNLNGAPSVDFVRKFVQRISPESFSKRALHESSQQSQAARRRGFLCFKEKGDEEEPVADHAVIEDNSHARRFPEPPSAKVDAIAPNYHGYIGSGIYACPNKLQKRLDLGAVRRTSD